MPQIDFNSLYNATDWQNVLDQLQEEAYQATTSSERHAVRQVLEDFVDACPFGTMRSQAVNILSDLAINDIGGALGYLKELQQQLARPAHRAASHTANGRTSNPRRQLLQTHALLLDLEELFVHHETLSQQARELNNTIEQLLSAPAEAQQSAKS